jgi:hypothetical protein
VNANEDEIDKLCWRLMERRHKMAGKLAVVIVQGSTPVYGTIMSEVIGRRR